jgi:predicted ATPase
MPIAAVSIGGYRSIQQIRFPVGPLTVFVGKNGVGKTNLYRALELLHAAADGTITRRIAEDGGAESVVWAGALRGRDPVRLTFAAEVDTLEYRVEIGLPMLSEVALCLEQGVKEEELRLHTGSTSTVLMQRQAADAWLLDTEGIRRDYTNALLPSETVLCSFRDVDHYPALEYVRRELADWRFYHTFRTEPGSALRTSCVALAAPMLEPDGRNLAAVLATLYYVRGNPAAVEEAVEEAFPGARLMVDIDKGRASIGVVFPDQPRVFSAHELSDGTLRYLCLIGALCSYRLPPLIALNEPEASLHGDLMPALAGLIARASQRTRIWVVTHSMALATELARRTGVMPGTVTKRGGATQIELPPPRSVGERRADRMRA